MAIVGQTESSVGRLTLGLLRHTTARDEMDVAQPFALFQVSFFSLENWRAPSNATRDNERISSDSHPSGWDSSRENLDCIASSRCSKKRGWHSIDGGRINASLLCSFRDRLGNRGCWIRLTLASIPGFGPNSFVSPLSRSLFLPLNDIRMCFRLFVST